jgi:hypothetical protein
MKTLFVLSALILFFAVGAMAQTNTLSDAEIQGRQLAQQLCDAWPTESITNSGILQIRDGNGNRRNVPVKCMVIVTADEWQSVYEASGIETLSVVHRSNQLNKYFYQPLLGDGTLPHSLFLNQSRSNGLAGSDLSFPFAGSDFWLCDLGLEFFHWPEQRVLKKEIRRSRGCTVLESTNPDQATNGYSRVVSWIDEESGGIVHAEAYDVQGKLLKEFDPKSFKKVNGQWQLQEMEIRNVQTGSRTRLEFDLTHYP